MMATSKAQNKETLVVSIPRTDSLSNSQVSGRQRVQHTAHRHTRSHLGTHCTAVPHTLPVHVQKDTKLQNEQRCQLSDCTPAVTSTQKPDTNSDLFQVPHEDSLSIQSKPGHRLQQHAPAISLYNGRLRHLYRAQSTQNQKKTQNQIQDKHTTYTTQTTTHKTRYSLRQSHGAQAVNRINQPNPSSTQVTGIAITQRVHKPPDTTQ
jgi:hypothetical protein